MLASAFVLTLAVMLLQTAPMTVSVSHQPHPLVLVPQGVPAPGQVPMVVPPPMQEYPRQEDYGRHPADADRFSPGLCVFCFSLVT